MGSRSSLTFKFEKAPLLALQRGEAVRVRTADGAEADLARPASGAVFLFDAKQPGLAARVPAVGEVRFWLYAWINGKAVKRSLGLVSEMSVDLAREEMVKEKASVLEGRKRDDEKAAAPAPKAEPSGPTLGSAFASYIKVQKTENRTWRDNVRQFRKYLKADAKRPLSEVSTEYLQSFHKRISTEENHPGAANRLLAMVSKMLRVAHKLPPKAPTAASLVPRNREEERDRTLTEDEERMFLAAIDKYEAEPAGVPGSKPLDREKFAAKQAKAQESRRTAADLLRVLYWTGQRAGDVRAMEWREVDFKARLWTIPAWRYKTGTPHTCALGEEALAILKRRKAAAQSGERYVFPAGNAKSKSGHFENYHNAFQRVKELAGIDAGEVKAKDRLRVHDLRAAYATALANAGNQAFDVRDQLGHRNIKTTMRYVRRSNRDKIKTVDRLSEFRRGASGTSAEEVA